MSVSHETLDEIADRVLARLDGRREGLIDAAEVARRLGISKYTVYENSARFGAVRIEDGPNARLRFDPQQVEAALRKPTDPPSVVPEDEHRPGVWPAVATPRRRRPK